MSENKKETKNQDMIEKEMKEKMKQTVEDEKIPGSLEPEAVEKMLETRKKKKSNNRRWKYASVAAAACDLSCSGSSRIYEYERRKK